MDKIEPGPGPRAGAAVRALAEHPDADFEGRGEESLVRSAEKALGLRFPPSYRHFLLELGAGDVDGFEIYGVIGPDFVNASIPDVVWATTNARENFDLPPELVRFAETGFGPWYVLDLSAVDDEGECPVALWTHSTVPLEWVASDFGVFLRSVLDGEF